MSDFARIVRDRQFQRYFGMNLASQTAASVANVAIVWYVFSVTSSTIDVTLVGAVESLAAVATTLPAGVWIDRHNRRTLLVVSNAVRAASLAILAVVSASYGFSLVSVVAVALVWSSISELFRSTNFSILPELVDPEKLPAANGVNQAGSSLLGSASNAIGGALAGFAGAVVAFLYCTVGYAVALLLSVLVHTRSVVPARATEAAKRKGFTEIREGFAWLVSQRGLFLLSVSAMAYNFFLGIFAYFLVVYAVSGLRAGAFVFGGLLALNVFGSAIGSLYAGRSRFLAGAGRAWVIAGLVSGPLILLIGVFPDPVVAAVSLLAVGVVFGFGNNLWLTAAHNLVPERMRGRYFAVDGLLSFVGGPPSIVVGGILISLIGVLPVYSLVGALLFVTALGFATAKSLWRHDGRRPAVTGASSS